MPNESEIERRLPVWHALSDLFLDTELEPQAYRRIATTLRRSGYSARDLRSIFEEEVVPAFAFNLFDITGEWAGWSREEVRAIVLRSLRSSSRLPPLHWLKKRSHRRYLDQEWAKISSLIDEG